MPMPPTIATTGIPRSLHRCPIPLGAFPKADCQSILPSPVTTRSTPSNSSLKCTRSSTVSIPDFRVAFRNTQKAAPNPPAAPEPGILSTSTPSFSLIKAAYRIMPPSRISRISGVPPFCLPKVKVAPSGPVRGFVTSHITVNLAWDTAGWRPPTSISATFVRSSPLPSSSWPWASRNRTPRARMAPMPPSLVALPPMAMDIFLYPLSRASLISSPVP